MDRAGNGAREALQRFFADTPMTVEAIDNMLIWLWLEGFVVKPLGDAELNPRKENHVDSVAGHQV